MRYFIASLILLVVSVISIAGFRGSTALKPPIEIFPDMDRQYKLKPQTEFGFYKDGRSDRLPVVGAVARGDVWNEKLFSSDYENQRFAEPELYLGKDQSGNYLDKIPVEVTADLMALGQQKYAIFCAVCHGAAGDGKGITSKYGVVGNMNYHNDLIRNQPDGEIYNTIVNGKGQMYPYNDKLTMEERWAVVAYVRALQYSQMATMKDVPQAHQSILEAKK